MRPFQYIDPPFNFNAAGVAQFPPEVSGNYLLKTMASRLGWDSIDGKKILDFGCGVRFAQTIVNLDIDIGLYAGIDVNGSAIDWLKEHIDDSRFIFEHLGVHHLTYWPEGPSLDEYPPIGSLEGVRFDVACMFSVITHQLPDDARRVFAFLRRHLEQGDTLYFTAFISEDVDGYREADPDHPTNMSTYHPDYLCSILAESGWDFDRRYDVNTFSQPVFVARAH